MDQLILVLELVGILSFAASGAMTAPKKNMDPSACASWAWLPPWAAGYCGTCWPATRPASSPNISAGALVCTALWHPAGELPAMLLGAGTVLSIRFLSAHFRWNLPHADD